MRDVWQGQEQVVSCGQLWWMVAHCPLEQLQGMQLQALKGYAMLWCSDGIASGSSRFHRIRAQPACQTSCVEHCSHMTTINHGRMIRTWRHIVGFSAQSSAAFPA